MSWLNRLARVLEPFAIPHLARYLALGQGLLLVTGALNLVDLRRIFLIPNLVLAGDWWRVVTFIFVPPTAGSNLGLLFAALGLYLLYLYGTILEQIWGTFRFNAYVFVGVVFTVLASFLSPYTAASNTFIYFSLFLAFAYLNPDFELYVFMILPMKIKWMAALVWAYGIGLFVTGDLSTKMAVLASVSNFLLFFSGDIWRRFRGTAAALSVPRAAPSGAPSTSGFRHRCRVCQRTDVSHPQLEFRYRADDACFCIDHLKEQPLVPPAPPEQK